MCSDNDHSSSGGSDPKPPGLYPVSGTTKRPRGGREGRLLAGVAGKVVGGRRLNSQLPCRGNIASSPAGCANSCVGNERCEGWTFTTAFNCGWIGESKPTGLCYLMSDVNDEAVYDAPNDHGSDFVSGWA